MPVLGIIQLKNNEAKKRVKYRLSDSCNDKKRFQVSLDWPTPYPAGWASSQHICLVVFYFDRVPESLSKTWLNPEVNWSFITDWSD